MMNIYHEMVENELIKEKYLVVFLKCELRVYASQNGQKKGRSLKITKHILSRFSFHKKLI